MGSLQSLKLKPLCPILNLAPSLLDEAYWDNRPRMPRRYGARRTIMLNSIQETLDLLAANPSQIPMAIAIVVISCGIFAAASELIYLIRDNCFGPAGH